MKKILSILLLCAMVMSLAACGNSAQQPEQPQQSTQSEAPALPETPAEPVQAGTDLAALVDQIYAVKMPEFMLMTMPVDLTDAEATAWLTGVSDPALLTGAVVSESMMGSQAYSLVLVQVADAARAEEVANMMLQNIDPVKWICVQADDIDAGIKGDLVLFVMIDSQFGMPAADFLAAFSQVMGGLDKELSK